MSINYDCQGVRSGGAPSLNVQQFFAHSFIPIAIPMHMHFAIHNPQELDDIELFVAGCRSGSTLGIGIEIEIESDVNDAGCVYLNYYIGANY